MGASAKGRRKISVNGRQFFWKVCDISDHEGCWTLDVISQDRKFHFMYPLIDDWLATVAADPRSPPLPPGFDTVSKQLHEGSRFEDTESFDHATVTPRFVRELILWLLEHEPEVDRGDFWKCCTWPTM